MVCTNLKKGPVIAIRHMVTPTLAFSFAPDFAGTKLGYYRYIEMTPTKGIRRNIPYSHRVLRFSNQYKAGVVSFALSNNLEMKVRSKKRHCYRDKKDPAYRDLSLRISYDIAKDS